MVAVPHADLHRGHVIGVLVFDVVDQPASQHRKQLSPDVLVVVEALLVQAAGVRHDNRKPRDSIIIGSMNNRGQADTAGIAPDAGGDSPDARPAAFIDNNAGEKNTEAAAAGGAIQDIFSETEEPDRDGLPKKPEAFQAKVNKEVKDQKPAIETEKHADRKKMLVLFFLLFGLIILGAGGFFAYRNFAGDFFSDFLKKAEIEENITEEPLASENNEPQPEQKESGSKTDNKKPDDKIIAPNPSMDSDQDGLSDEEERVLGTDINNLDSDSDGLFDREEVKVYKTDPLNADTDGDSYLDGMEVKAGYNPRGTGKLYKVK